MTEYWVSCKWATGYVSVNDKMEILNTAPVWKRFIGQPINNLLRWLRVYDIKEIK